MPTSLVALEIFLILLPGFAAAYVVQQLATRRTQSDLERVIEALLFSFIIYVCFAAANHGRLPFNLQKQSVTETEPGGAFPTGNSAAAPAETSADQDDAGQTIVWNAGSLGLLAGITFVFAILAILYINHDGNRLFRRLHLTERTTRSSIWTDIFESEAGREQIVQVELPGNRSVLGVLLYYSDDPDENSLFIAKAAWVTSEGEQIPIPGQGILLTKQSGILSISLLSPGTRGEP
ncbi:MAG TPA: DUF6338 family protein [Acidobacteriaceae bacterium]